MQCWQQFWSYYTQTSGAHTIQHLTTRHLHSNTDDGCLYRKKMAFYFGPAKMFCNYAFFVLKLIFCKSPEEKKDSNDF
jgi:hypothetical protein